MVLFDGVCNLCNGSVQFIIKRDPKGYFKFASLQGEAGKELIKGYGIPENSDSFILIKDGEWYSKSSAALRVCRHLKGFWKLLYIVRFIPRQIRDHVYDIVARNRYKWFGKSESCMIPDPKLKDRFLD
ncbi:thiol-disulfide oxidoreductase DCC family protein [Scopulibacillus darangshiensis]|uniref:thiol-disulfide oxidoreductase DCC family protein n=1 Tax=Scopulibacillus darangshiensis TaxID=442528 RepID=UPI001FB23B8E|nr:thiol-disulfide oxidoreductase DCC family protein [Scopulibacillus darangshiensis]